MCSICPRWRELAAIAGLALGYLIFAHCGRAAETSLAGQYAALPGVKLWFTDTGGAGTPIVLLHANTGTSESWQAQSTAFARQGYRVIAFDRRGWGKSLIDPTTGRSVVALGMVGGIAIRGGHVAVTLHVDPARGTALEPLRQGCEQEEGEGEP